MYWFKKLPYFIIIFTLLGCSNMKIENFANAKPEFNLMEFFEGMPKLRHVIQVTNPKTKKKGEVVVEGLQSFLG